MRSACRSFGSELAHTLSNDRSGARWHRYFPERETSKLCSAKRSEPRRSLVSLAGKKLLVSLAGKKLLVSLVSLADVRRRRRGTRSAGR